MAGDGAAVALRPRPACLVGEIGRYGEGLAQAPYQADALDVPERIVLGPAVQCIGWV